MSRLLELDRDDPVNGIKLFNRSAHFNGAAGKYSWRSSACWECSNTVVPSKMPEGVFFSHVFFICADRQIALVCFRGQWQSFLF